MSFQRMGRRFVAWGSASVLVISVTVVLAPWEASGPSDPSRFGPPRTLTLESARLETDAGDAHLLRASGRSNLVDGALLTLSVLADGRPVLETTAEVRGGAFGIEVASRGAVALGDYRLRATFALEAQTPAVREALHFQPRRLAAVRPLDLPLEPTDAGTGVQAEFRAIFDQVNEMPRDPETLRSLDRQARELNDRLFVARQKTALHKLRLAIAAAGRATFDRREFERLLLEAHVLAGL